jgi:hypothetical protein
VKRYLTSTAMKGLALLLGHLTDGRQIIVDENTKIGIFVVAG